LTNRECHNHHWATQADSNNYICENCAQETPPCHTCHNNPAWIDKACNHCIKKARRTLDDIQEALNHPMAPILPIRAMRYDKDTRSSTTDRMPFGIGQNLDDPTDLAATAAATGKEILQLTQNPDTMTDALKDWAEAWAEQRNETTPTNWLKYLHKATQWAANNPQTSGWHDYHRDARLIRARLRHIVGLAPEREAIPCPYCGATLQRHWTNEGLADEIRCTNPNCERQTYRNLADLYWIASSEIQQAPDKSPDTLIHRDLIPHVYPHIKKGTLRKWISEGELTPTTRDRRGRDLYRISDVKELEQRAYKTA